MPKLGPAIEAILDLLQLPEGSPEREAIRTDMLREAHAQLKRQFLGTEDPEYEKELIEIAKARLGNTTRH